MLHVWQHYIEFCPSRMWLCFLFVSQELLVKSWKSMLSVESWIVKLHIEKELKKHVCFQLCFQLCLFSINLSPEIKDKSFIIYRIFHSSVRVLRRCTSGGSWRLRTSFPSLNLYQIRTWSSGTVILLDLLKVSLINVQLHSPRR